MNENFEDKKKLSKIEFQFVIIVAYFFPFFECVSSSICTVFFLHYVCARSNKNAKNDDITLKCIYLPRFFYLLFISFFSFLFVSLIGIRKNFIRIKDTDQINVLDTNAVIYVVKYTVMLMFRVTNDIIVHTHKKLHTYTVIYAHFHHDDLTIFAHTCVPNIKL